MEAFSPLGHDAVAFTALALDLDKRKPGSDNAGPVAVGLKMTLLLLLRLLLQVLLLHTLFRNIRKQKTILIIISEALLLLLLLLLLKESGIRSVGPSGVLEELEPGGPADDAITAASPRRRAAAA